MKWTFCRALFLVLHVLHGIKAVISFQVEKPFSAASYELLQVQVSGESADEVFGADSFGHHDGSFAAVADALRGLRRRFPIAGRHRVTPHRAHSQIRTLDGRTFAPPGRFLFTVNRTADGFLLHRAEPNTTAERSDREGDGGMEDVLMFIIGILVVALLAIGIFFCCKRRAETEEKKQEARMEYEERERKAEEIRKMVIEAQAREDAERAAQRVALKAEQARLEEEDRLQREQEQARLAAEEKLKRAKKITRKALERHAKKVEQERRARELAAAKEAEDKCAKCGDPITGQYVTVDGNVYHEKCFTCVHCEVPIAGNEFALTIDGPVCRACDEKKAAKCFTCGLRIQGTIKKVEGNCYHEACCVCTRCGVQITDSYFPTDSGIICNACDEKDYLASLPVCVKCKQPIESSCAVVEGNTMHKACFQCAKCFGMIKGSYYKLGEGTDRYECEECHESTS